MILKTEKILQSWNKKILDVRGTSFQRKRLRESNNIIFKQRTKRTVLKKFQQFLSPLRRRTETKNSRIDKQTNPVIVPLLRRNSLKKFFGDETGSRDEIKSSRRVRTRTAELSYPRPRELPARFLRASARVRFLRVRDVYLESSGDKPCEHPLKPFANSLAVERIPS